MRASRPVIGQGRLAWRSKDGVVNQLLAVQVRHASQLGPTRSRGSEHVTVAITGPTFERRAVDSFNTVTISISLTARPFVCAMMTRASSKRGRALSGKPFASHRADRDHASTVLSVLAGAHSVGAGILGFFDTKEVRAIRLVCSEFREAVAAVPWADMGTRISRNAGGWRASFPHATKANISVDDIDPPILNAIVDVDFVHFNGLHTLDMTGCNQAGITDAAFVHLGGIHTLFHAGVQPSGHHGRRIRPPQGDPHAQHVEL